MKYITELDLEDFIKSTIHDMGLTRKAYNNLSLLINGIFKYANGDKYTGSFSANKRNGEGTYTWKEDGARYTGSWSNDKMDGSGTYYYSDEEYPRLEGGFSDGAPESTCTYYETANVKYRTTWSDGECEKVEEQK